MSSERQPDLEVGYGDRPTVAAGNAVNGARVAQPPFDGTGDAVNGARVSRPPAEKTGDAVNGARVAQPPFDGERSAVNGARASLSSAEGTGDAVNGARASRPDAEGTGDAVNGARISCPPGDGPRRPRGATRARASLRADTDVSVHRITRLLTAVVLPFFVLVEVLGLLVRSGGTTVRRVCRACSSALRPVPHLLSAAAVTLARSAAGPVEWVIDALEAVVPRVERVGCWMADRLRPAAHWCVVAARAAFVVAARAAAAGLAVVGRALALTGRGLRFAGRAVRAVLAPVGRTVVALLRWLGRGLRVAARAAGAVLAVVGRTVVTLLRWLGRGLRVAARAVGAVLAPVGATARWLSVGVGRGLQAAARAVRTVLAPVGATARWLSVRVGRGLKGAGIALGAVVRVALVGARTALGWLGAGGVRVAAWLWPLVVSTSGPFRRAATGVGRTVGRHLGNLGRRVARTIARMAGRFARMGRDLARRLDGLGLAGGLALGAAGRRARRLAGTTRGADLAPVAGGEVTTGGTARRPAPLTRPTRGAAHAGGGVTFSVAVSQNAYLGVGAGVVDALVTVSALVDRPANDIAAPELAELILLDCSSSMNHPSRKMAAARLATQAAIDCLRDGVAFALVRCTGKAEVVYPTDATLAVASSHTRLEAKAAAAELEAGGGTAFGPWLRAARDLFQRHPGAIHHALLLTDGRDEGESTGDLSAVLDECAGQYQCDCRGVGTDWHVAELRQVATALLGTVDIIPDPADMEADFRAITDRAMSRVVDGVSLRIRTPMGARIEFVRQVVPSIEELRPAPGADDSMAEEFATGAWGREVRRYLLRVRVAPGREGTEMLAARVQVMVDGTARGEAKVLATWTRDAMVAGYIDPEVARATGQADLAAAVREGLAAKRRGDESGATRQLGRAVQLAAETASVNVGALLAKVVDVEDAVTGTVTLRRRTSAVDEMVLDARSTNTVAADGPGTPGR